MATTAILTYAQRVTVTTLDSNNNPVATFTMQVTNAEPSQTLQEVDMTNSESGGFAEFAPTVLLTEFTMEGIVDINGSFEAVWFTCMQTRVFALVKLYFTKVETDPNAVYYYSNVLFKQARLTGRVTSQGSLWGYNFQSRGVTRWKKSGTALTGATVTGFSQA